MIDEINDIEKMLNQKDELISKLIKTLLPQCTMIEELSNIIIANIPLTQENRNDMEEIKYNSEQLSKVFALEWRERN